MKTTIVATIVRVIVTVLLLIGVYSETGIWTTIVLSLICLEIELRTLVANLKKDSDRELERKINSMFGKDGKK